MSSKISEQDIEEVGGSAPETNQRGKRRKLPPVPKFDNISAASADVKVPAQNEQPAEKRDMSIENPKDSSPVKMEEKKPPKIDMDKLKSLLDSKPQLQNLSQSLASAKKTSEAKPSPLLSKDSVFQLQKAKEEYDPARPHDFEVVMAERKKKQRDEEKKKNKANDSAEDLKAEKSDDRYDNDRRYSQDAMQIETKAPELSSEEKILNMLEKTGWKAGRGLGKNEQGMTTPLIARKTNSTTAVITNSTLDVNSLLSPEVAMRKAAEQFYNRPPTRILLLLNMIDPNSIDAELREEVIFECENYGRVIDCAIHLVKNVPEDQAVRIFVEFDKKECATNAFTFLYGRAFGGRQVLAKFYDESSYINKNYDAAC